MRQLKQLSLLLGLLLLGPSAYAQSVRFQSQAISTRGAGIANATVAVCTQPANTNTQPCSPLATLATSTSTTSGGANPLTADSFGNFFFYAAPGRYTVQIYGPAVSGQFVTPDVVLACDPTGACAAKFSSTNNILWVDGTTYTTIDAAIAAVPSFSIVAATGCSESSFTVTCTTTTPHSFAVNQVVYVSGVGVLGYNGFWTTIAGTTGTTVKYTNTVSGLGTSGGGTAAAAANIIIPSTYLGAEAATCSSLDTAGHDNGAAQGYTMALTPPNIHIEDRRSASACNYNVSYNSGQIGARPSDIAVARVDTSPNLTSSNIVGLIQYTGTLPSAQSLASVTGETDLIGNVTLPAGIFVQVINGQWAIRSVGGTVSQVMGIAGGGGIDRTFDTTNITQAVGLYGFDPKNVAVTGTAFSITNATEAGATATITTSAICNFTTGTGVSVSGVGVNGYNGAWTVLAPGCNGGSTFTYTETNFGLANSSGGTAQKYGATIQESYGLLAAMPQTGIRNNDTAFFQGPVVFADNIGGIDVMNQNYVLPAGATAQPLLRFGGDNSQSTGGVNQYSTAFGGVPYKYLVVAGNQTNWLTCSACNNANSFEITPSTAAGGTSFTTPGFRVFNNGAGGASTVAIPQNLQITTLLESGTVPTIAAAGCGGAAASIVVANGTAAFKVNVGTAPTSACTLTFPAATTGWNVTCNDITTQSTNVFVQKQTGVESTTSVTITNFSDVAVATAFVASDILKCTAAAD